MSQQFKVKKGPVFGGVIFIILVFVLVYWLLSYFNVFGGHNANNNVTQSNRSSGLDGVNSQSSAPTLNNGKYDVVVPDFGRKNRNSFPVSESLMPNKQCMITMCLVKRWLFTFAFKTDGKNQELVYSNANQLLFDLALEKEANKNAENFNRLAIGELRSANAECATPSNKPGNIQFFMNSTAAQLPGVIAAKPGISEKFVVTTTDVTKEGEGGLLSAIPDSLKRNAAVWDLTSDFSRISYYDQNGNPKTNKEEGLGYDFYSKKVDPEVIRQKAIDAVNRIPAQNRQNIIIIWTALKNLGYKDNNQPYMYLGEIQGYSFTSIEDEKMMVKSGLFILNTAQNELDNEMVYSLKDHFTIGLTKLMFKN